MRGLVNNQSGQGLLELVVAIGVITTGLFSVWALFLSNYHGEQEANARILAVSLAREGVEIVRNIRDSNWLHRENNDACVYNGVIDNLCRWDSGLVGDGSAVIANQLSENVYLDFVVADTLADDGARIFIGAAGFYNHDSSGAPTVYRRLLTLENICCASADGTVCANSDFRQTADTCQANELKVGVNVRSQVGWLLQGRARELTVNQQLYNWK